MLYSIIDTGNVDIFFVVPPNFVIYLQNIIDYILYDILYHILYTKEIKKKLEF